MRSVLRKGFMYRISQKPETLIYVSENKSLAGKEDKAIEGEASGRKLVVTFFEDGDDGLAHRVDREGCALRPQLLNIAEMLQALGFALPPDPERTAATTELLLEEHYQNLRIVRLTCTCDTEAPEPHVYTLSDDVDAEDAMALETSPDARTKMVLVREVLATCRCPGRGRDLGEGLGLEPPQTPGSGSPSLARPSSSTSPCRRPRTRRRGAARTRQRPRPRVKGWGADDEGDGKQ